MRYVRVKGYYPYQHRVPGELVVGANGTQFRLPDTDRMEVVEPGSVVGMGDDLAKSFVDRGLGVFCDGPENLIRPVRDDVERPGADPRAARAEQATGRAQRVGAV